MKSPSRKGAMMLAWEIATVAWGGPARPGPAPGQPGTCKDHAKLGDDAEERRDRRREDDGGGLGPDVAQQDGPEVPATTPDHRGWGRADSAAGP